MFDSHAEATGSVLAAHAAAAILASRRGEQLESALATRDVIGQAKGIIMERFKVDAVRAFDMLRELSQTTNTKLVDVAQRVVDTAHEPRRPSRPARLTPEVCWPPSGRSVG